MYLYELYASIRARRSSNQQTSEEWAQVLTRLQELHHLTMLEETNVPSTGNDLSVLKLE